MSKDGRLVAAVEEDETGNIVSIWDVIDKGHPHRTARLRTGTVASVESLVLAPDAKTLAVADGQDNSL